MTPKFEHCDGLSKRKFVDNLFESDFLELLKVNMLELIQLVVTDANY
jgi:hypothetical protein